MPLIRKVNAVGSRTVEGTVAFGVPDGSARRTKDVFSTLVGIPLNRFARKGRQPIDLLAIEYGRKENARAFKCHGDLDGMPVVVEDRLAVVIELRLLLRKFPILNGSAFFSPTDLCAGSRRLLIGHPPGITATLRKKKNGVDTFVAFPGHRIHRYSAFAGHPGPLPGRGTVLELLNQSLSNGLVERFFRWFPGSHDLHLRNSRVDQIGAALCGVLLRKGVLDKCAGAFRFFRIEFGLIAWRHGVGELGRNRVFVIRHVFLIFSVHMNILFY